MIFIVIIRTAVAPDAVALVAVEVIANSEEDATLKVSKGLKLSVVVCGCFPKDLSSW